jgi:hypothetical protein
MPVSAKINPSGNDDEDPKRSAGKSTKVLLKSVLADNDER